MIAEFSIHPIGQGTSVSRYVKAAIRSFSRLDGLEYEVNPMSTVMESENLETILAAVGLAHEAVRDLGAKRVSSLVRIDERLDKPRKMRDKVRAVA